MVAYYNEIDPSAAEWLRRLIAAGHIADGIVDERSIEDVSPDELTEFTQCHFFAGIGGWSYALRLAGWPDDKHVWTGSCPCQPYSQAGAKGGDNDPRALWWAFRWQIQQCRPPVVFGEQVASKAGREWFAGVRADLEALAYAVGAADLCAAGVGAPHIRQRLFWVADNQGIRWDKRRQDAQRSTPGIEAKGIKPGLADDSGGHGMANSQSERQEWWKNSTRQAGRCVLESDCGWLPNPEGERFSETGPDSQRPTKWSAWSRSEWVDCADGKRRRIEPGLSPLAHGVSGRMAIVVPDKQTGAAASHSYNRAAALTGFGNAIVPQVAAEFISAFLDGSPLP